MTTPPPEPDWFYLKEMPAELVLHQNQQRLVLSHAGRLQSHRQQLQTHVHHGVCVVTVVRVRQRNEKTEELSEAGQAVGDQRRS